MALEELLTLEEFNTLSAESQGYVSYLQSEHPGSQIPKSCPESYSDEAKRQWTNGERQAIMEVIDSSE